MSVAEIGLLVLMFYGLLLKEKTSAKITNAIQIITTITICALACFTFSGKLTIIEFTASGLILAGTYFLTQKNFRLGWLIMLLSHLCAAYLGISKNQDFFAHFQIASAIVSFAGAIKTKSPSTA
jgi:hypothetical protein